MNKYIYKIHVIMVNESSAVAMPKILKMIKLYFSKIKFF